MSKLSEEKENATRMIALRQWVGKFERDNKRPPNTKELWNFIQALNDRTPPNTPEALVNLIDKEKKVREVARKIAHNEMIPVDCFVINLKPSTNYTMLVKGSNPSVIELGILPGDPDFMTILRRGIRKAAKLYRPSALIPVSKVVEYKRDIKKFEVWKNGEDYYPLLPEERIQVRVYEMFRIIDTKTGNVVTRTRETEVGMFRHLKNNPLVQEGRLDLSRKLYAEGIIKKEDFEDDEGAIQDS